MFSGTAAATNSKQINFCGCSQICVEVTASSGGAFWVLLADEDESGGFTYSAWRSPEESSFCYEVGDDEFSDENTKIIGLISKPGTENPPACGFLNPGRCAADALDGLSGDIPVVNTTSSFEVNGTEVAWQNDDFGEADGDCGRAPVPVIVQGRCGKPGRAPPGRTR
jgi:hypothetical protein